MSVNIEHIIKEIISIDKEAEIYKKDLEVTFAAKREELQETIAALHKDSEKKLNLMKKELMDLKLKETEKAIEQVMAEKDIALITLKENYIKAREEILEEVLDKLINLGTS